MTAAEHTISIDAIDEGWVKWKLHCHHEIDVNPDDYPRFDGYGEIIPDNECWVQAWFGEADIELVNIQEPITTFPIPVDAEDMGDGPVLTLHRQPDQ